MTRDPRPIAVVLPPKERFCAEGAGAVSLCVRDMARSSRFGDRLGVLGMPVERPFDGIAFEGVAPGAWRLLGRNRGLAMAVARRLGHAGASLVEVHNRPAMARLFRDRAGGWRTTLHLHNDPQTMGGMGRPEERRALLDRLDGMLCVSDFVRDRFLEGIDDAQGKVRRIYNGVHLRPPAARPKRREVLFVGRLVADKGVAHLAQALATLLPARPGWTARLIGATWFGRRAPDAFERQLQAQLSLLGDRVHFEGFKPHEDVLAAMDEAAIVAVPTLIDEAFARVAAEAMAGGSAVVAYPSGGLAEIGRGRALVTAARDPALLEAALANLMDDPAALHHWQTAARADFPFAIERVTAELDDWRETLLAPSSVGAATAGRPSAV